MRANGNESPFGIKRKDLDAKGKPKLPWIESWTTVKGLATTQMITSIDELDKFDIDENEYKRIKDIFDNMEMPLYLTCYPRAS